MTLQDALKIYGSRSRIAQALGLNRQSITRWKDGIPMRRQYELELLSRGRLRVSGKAK